jgi:hypothetical protein
MITRETIVHYKGGNLMKKIYLNLFVMLALSNLATTMQAAIYLQNNYGPTIEYVQTTPELAALQPANNPPVKLGNGARAEVGGSSSYLSIRTVGGRYSNISSVFKDIHIQQTNHGGDNALIVVYPRQGLSGVYSWNIQIEWETPTTIPGFSKKTGALK